MSVGVGSALGIAAIFLSSFTIPSTSGGATRTEMLEAEQRENDVARQMAEIEALRAAQAERESGSAEPVK